MSVLLAEYRGLANLLLLLGITCAGLIYVIRKQNARDFLIMAGDQVGAIGIGIVWTVLIYRGPSLNQLWQGAPGISHWTTVLLYTMIWLSSNRVAVVANGAELQPARAMRVALQGCFFFLAVVGLNDW